MADNVLDSTEKDSEPVESESTKYTFRGYPISVSAHAVKRFQQRANMSGNQNVRDIIGYWVSRSKPIRISDSEDGLTVVLRFSDWEFIADINLKQKQEKLIVITCYAYAVQPKGRRTKRTGGRYHRPQEKRRLQFLRERYNI